MQNMAGVSVAKGLYFYLMCNAGKERRECNLEPTALPRRR